MSVSSTTLSPQDEILFEKYLLRNKQFILLTKSKNHQVEQHFPLYFGTTEEEINPHRKMAFRQRRLIKDSRYNTPQLLQNQPKKVVQEKSKLKISTPNKSNGSVIATPNVATAATIKSGQSSKQNTVTKKQEKVSTKEPEAVSKVSKESTSKPSISATTSTASIPTTSDISASSLSSTTNADSTTSVVASSTEPTKEPVKPAPAPTMANILASTKPLSMAENLKRSTQNKAAATSTASRSKPTSKSSTASPVSTPNATFDTVSSEFLTFTTPKPLGITLLRIMFDSQYITKIFNTKKGKSLINPHGLQNSGNICYMNSVLQFLFYCDPFSHMLVIIKQNTVKELDKSKDNTPILNALLDLLDSFQLASKTENKIDTINPEPFYSSIATLPRFSHLRWGNQEDAEEFLNILLDGLHEEFVESIKILPDADVNSFAHAFSNKETTRKILQNVDFIKDVSKEVDNNDNWNEVNSTMKTVGKRSVQVKLSPIVTLFGGQFKSVLKFSSKKSSITLDPFMQVQLDISDPETHDLTTAFEKFSQDEEISLGSNMAKKQNFIDKLPSVLIIHLKRFSYVTTDESNSENGDYEIVGKNKKKKNGKEFQQANNNFAQQNKSKLLDGRIEKIHKFIKYDHNLTLPKSCISPMVSEEPNYKLLGVVYHHGRSTENGHYTTDVLASSDEWIRIDDTNITKITADDAVSDQNLLSNINKTAYILMFQKV